MTAVSQLFGGVRLTAPADADLLPGTDVSDTTASPNGTTKAMLLSVLKAYIATSLAHTGTPTAPTAAPGTNNTQLATTAYADAIAALKANLASPALTGTPTAPTAAPGTNSTQLATTAYADAIATLKANLASPTFTGTPAAPTASQGTNTTQLATTAFVVAAVAALQANLGRRGTVRVATTANITIATALNSGDAIDGVTLANGDLVLVKNQSAPAENGVYEVSATPARASEFDTWNDHPGALLAVQEGTTQADTLWLCTTNVGGTLNTTAIAFAQFSAAGALLAANNLSDLASAATARTNLGLTALATTTPGTGVATFLTTPTSANLRAAVTDEDGTGALMFAKAPVTLSGATNLVRATHGNLLLILDTAATHTVEDDTTGAWQAGDTIFGVVTAASGAVILQGDGTATVTAGYGMTLTGYSGQEFSLVRVGANAWRGGFQDLSLQQNSQSAAYTTVMEDRNKQILHPASDNNARTFTIDSNANVPYPVGTSLTFINLVNTLTIGITSDTLILAGAGTTGSRTLAANGMATALKVAATTWIINGTGLT